MHQNALNVQCPVARRRMWRTPPGLWKLRPSPRHGMLPRGHLLVRDLGHLRALIAAHDQRAHLDTACDAWRRR